MPTIPPALHPGKSDPALNPLLYAALDYAGRGWRVFPIHSPTVDKCSCGKPDCKKVGKHPRTAHGLTDASTDATIIRDWWERWPAANVGIATGPESGVFVLDVDGEDGQASLKGLEALGHLPQTLRAHTGRTGQDGQRTGFHLYFNYPAGANLRNSAGALGQGLDIRAAGGYVVAPPSLHASGLRYEWAQDDAVIAEAPALLIAKASKLADAPTTQQTGFLYEGQRNDVLFRLACSWRRHGATQDQLERQLLAENVRRCRPPVERDEILKLAANVASRYSPGGPDPLEEAWAKAEADGPYYCSWDKFLALLRNLHNSRPGLPILLPVVRIGKLIGCDRTLVGRHRRRAISLGLIREVKAYIPHETATLFMVLTLPE
jgi:hypothetical protein